jgi:amino acid synthesis protein
MEIAMKIRKIVTTIEEMRREADTVVNPPIRRVAACAVIENPFAGRHEQDLQLLIDYGEQLGSLLSDRAVAVLGKDNVDCFGKGAIVGTHGELEHAAALLHPKLGGPLRAAIGGGKAIIPSAKKVAGPGSTLDVPLHFKDAAFVRSHFDAIEVRISDAPRENEIVVAVALTDGGGPLARVGGLQKHEIQGSDGLR